MEDNFCYFNVTSAMSTIISVINVKENFSLFGTCIETATIFFI